MHTSYTLEIKNKLFSFLRHKWVAITRPQLLYEENLWAYDSRTSQGLVTGSDRPMCHCAMAHGPPIKALNGPLKVI